MKVLHCCLAAFYIDDFGYQENVLPKIHKMQGHEVVIAASTETYVEKVKMGYVKAGSYISSDNIKVNRLPYINWLPHIVARKLRVYEGLKKILYEFQPDLIFMHDCQFVSVRHIAEYARKRKVRIIIDCHTDFINSGRSWVSRNLLHKILYRWCAKRIDKYTEKFYGTLPLRSDFLQEVYGISRDKIDLLPFGIDDSLFVASDKPAIRDESRVKFGFATDDFVIVSGGKIDERKNIHLLIEAFLQLSKTNSKVKLLLFGKPTEQFAELIKQVANEGAITYLDWVNSKEIFRVLLAGDLAFFPGTHSVLWEEALGLGLPCVFKRWKGIEHVDLGGNCLMMDEVSPNTIQQVLTRILKEKQLFERMREISASEGPTIFSYTNIAKRALEY